MDKAHITDDSTSVVYIGSGTLIRGNLDAPSEVIVNGRFEGTLNASQVTVEKNGYLSGITIADNVIVYGRIDQELVSTNSLQIHATGVVTGNVSYYDIEISKGGQLDGTLIHRNV